MSSQMSTIRRSKRQKLKALAAKFSIDIAKTYNDPMYSKYKRFRDLFWDLKLKIGKKYRQRALIAARQAMKGKTPDIFAKKKDTNK